MHMFVYLLLTCAMSPETSCYVLDISGGAVDRPESPCNAIKEAIQDLDTMLPNDRGYRELFNKTILPNFGKPVVSE